MIETAAVWVQLFLSFGALVGLLVLQAVLLSRDPWGPITRRFLFVLRAVGLLFAGRVLIILTGLDAFRMLVLLGAALIPLSVLLLAEGLLRRHAPKQIKAFVAIGAVLAVVSAFWYSDSIDPHRLIALLVFQLASFAAVGWMVWTRDMASLSSVENKTVERLGLCLFLIIPLSLGDFLLVYLPLPIQFSALGVLVLCWLAIGLGRAHQGHRATLANLTVLTAAAVGLSLMLGFLAQLDGDGVLLCMAMTLTTFLLVSIIHDARSFKVEEQSLSLLRHLATADTDDPAVFLRQLQGHPLVEGAAVVSAETLSGLQDDILDRIFEAAPVLRQVAPPNLDETAKDHIEHLFDRYAATHIMMVKQRPRVVLALSMPSLNAGPTSELELRALQRMAALMSKLEEQVK